MEQRREGIIKGYKGKGYGRIMLDGQDGNRVFVTMSDWGRGFDTENKQRRDASHKMTK
jgi:hypothetical protein